MCYASCLIDDLRYSRMLIKRRDSVLFYCSRPARHTTTNKKDEKMNYIKSDQYTDLQKIYAQCSGPGGLQLAEFMAEKMRLEHGKKLVDIGYNRGYQTCFLAKEYGVDVVAIDPLDDLETGLPNSDYLMANADEFGMRDRILGVKSGVPESLLPSAYFDYAYSTTTLEMVRGYAGADLYLASLKEIHRILKKGGVFGLGEPMHFDVPVPEDLAASAKENMWEDCFATIDETKAAVAVAGFTVLESGYCKEADRWWKEFARYEPQCVAEDAFIIENNRNRWLSFGYVIAKK